ncbi:MAG TPA: RNA methyltransferase, partial [Bacteroidia bacterium]|nr:RNA methyltransferase [Bacteroidia bacterium]
NLGTIIRIADWFGIEDIICSEETVEVYNPKVIQATMGSISRVRVHYTDLVSFLEESKKELPSLNVYGALLDGDNLFENPLTAEGYILIGNESKGISPELIPFVTDKIRIPSFAVSDSGLKTGATPVSGIRPVSGAESLNAAIAASIICSEFRRRGIKQKQK